MTGVTPDYFDSSDGVGDSFDASLYGLSYWETVEGMLVTIPTWWSPDGFITTSGGQPIFPGLFARSRQSEEINSRGGYTIAGDPPIGRSTPPIPMTIPIWRSRPPRWRRQSGRDRSRFQRLRDFSAGRAHPDLSMGDHLATSPASSSSISPTAIVRHRL